jgi:hypothetical protein
VAPAFSVRLRFRRVRHDGGRKVGSLALQQPFAGFLTAPLGLPMRCVFGVAGQNQLGLLTHLSIPLPQNDDLPPSAPLGMDGDAPNAMGSPELEDHDAFVIENVCRAARIRSRDKRRRLRTDAQRPSTLSPRSANNQSWPARHPRLGSASPAAQRNPATGSSCAACSRDSTRGC